MTSLFTFVNCLFALFLDPVMSPIMIIWRSIFSLYIWCDEKYLPNIPQQPAIMKNKIFYLPLIILLPIVNIVKSDVGGHDLFTSLAQLEVLWYNEIEIIKVMERAITNMEKATKSLQK